MAVLLHMLPLGSAWLKLGDGHSGELICDSLAKDTANVFLLGEGRGKTSLSFQLAVSMAVDNRHVMYIRPHVLSHLPVHVHGMPTPESAALQLVKLWYPEKGEEIVNWCARVHMLSLLPEVIIIDDFDIYINQSKSPEHETARLTAALVDAAAWIASKSNQCPLVFTASHRVTSLPSVLRQFNFRMVEVHRSGSDVDHESFQLRWTQPSSKMSFVTDYAISRQHIMLNTVHSNSLANA